MCPRVVRVRRVRVWLRHGRRAPADAARRADARRPWSTFAPLWYSVMGSSSKKALLSTTDATRTHSDTRASIAPSSSQPHSSALHTDRSSTAARTASSKAQSLYHFGAEQLLRVHHTQFTSCVPNRLLAVRRQFAAGEIEAVNVFDHASFAASQPTYRQGVHLQSIFSAGHGLSAQRSDPRAR